MVRHGSELLILDGYPDAGPGRADYFSKPYANQSSK
jgi:hypothetical protein